MKDTTLCIKFTILEKCLNYLMITPRNNQKRQNSFFFLLSPHIIVQLPPAVIIPIYTLCTSAASVLGELKTRMSSTYITPRA